MQINPKLRERLDSSLVESFVERMNKKVEPEQFIAGDSGNFRVRNIEEKKQKFDALSTATSNFYNADQQTPGPRKAPTGKVLDQSKVLQMKQSLRVNSALPSRPLLIKRTSQKQTQNIEQQEATEPIQQFSFQQSFMRKLTTPTNNAAPQSLENSQNDIKTQMRRMSQRKVELSNRPMIKFDRLAPLKSQAEKQTEDQKLDSNEVRDSLMVSPNEKKVPQLRSFNQAPKRPLVNKENQEIYESMDIDILKEITALEEEALYELRYVQFRFDASNDSLYNLGEMLPQLQQLKLNNSSIESLRLLGTRLTGLQILWISNSKLNDISGINSMPQLQELYCAFNNIKDISPLAFHESITILDVEANELGDEMQIDYLESLRLTQLNISNNPIAYNQQLRSRLQEILKSTEIIIQDNGFRNESQIIEDDTQQLQQLYEIASYMDNQLEVLVFSYKVQNLDDLHKLEQNVRESYEKDLMDEPDEDRILKMKIKAKPLQRPKSNRPQTAGLPDPTSSLVGNSDIFVGNPIKAAKKAKQNDVLDRQSMDIQSLLNRFQ